MADYSECDICGTAEASNVSIQSEIATYLDGPRRARIPEMTFCRDCADEISIYLNERAGQLEENDEEKYPFSESDAEGLLDKLEEKRNLVLELSDGGHGYGYRYEDGELKYAHTPVPSPSEVTSLDREELKDRITSAPRVTLKRLDKEAWRRYEES
jgi:hypothetical protein